MELLLESYGFAFVISIPQIHRTGRAWALSLLVELLLELLAVEEVADESEVAKESVDML